jgi:hypothetical protein
MSRALGEGDFHMPRMLIGAMLAAALVAGCAYRPLGDSLLLERVNPDDTSNQIYFTPEEPGPAAYAALFEKVSDAVDDVFEITKSSRYDGEIEGAPRVAPGLGQPFKPGSPNLYERTLASFQSMRHRCFVLIKPEAEGYVVIVTVFKELEDVPIPLRNPGVSGAFRSDANVDRVYEVVDPSVESTAWIPKGRDYPLEQKLLRKIRDKVDGLR